MNYARGVLLWLSSDALNSTKTISGLPFQPKALKFTVVTASNTQDLNDFVSDIPSSWWSFGFAAGISNRRCVSTYDENLVGTAICSSAFRDDCVVMAVNPLTPTAIDGRLDLDAINSDGFRLIVDDTAGSQHVVMWEAWGGADITVVEAISIAEPAATGNVDYTVTGFTADGIGQVVMFAGVQQTGATPAVGRTDSGRCIGFASGTIAADNAVVLGNSDDASGLMDTDGYCKTGECLAMITLGGGNPNARAQLTQWNENGFRLNWIARATTNRRYIALAIKGGLWKAGAYTIEGNTLNATATVSGLAFQPIGVDLIGRMTVEQAAGVSTVEDRMSAGSASSPSARNAFGILSVNGPTTSDINTIREYDELLAFPSATATIQALYDLDAINADGFRVIVDTAGGVASEWQGFLAFGTAVVEVQVTRDEKIPAEWRASLARDERIPVEWLASFVRLEALPVEWQGALARSEALPVEWLAALARDEQIPVEWLTALARGETLPVEWQGQAAVALARDEALAVEWLAALARDEKILLEWLAGLVRDETAPVEWRGAVARDEVVPVDWSGALARDEKIPVDWAGALLARGETLPVEWAGALAREETVPVEWQGAAPAVQFVRDEGIPVESSASPSLLLFFNWLAAGAGAPWPPARLAFLAQQRGVGRVWWTGWSRARWVPGLGAIPVGLGRVVRLAQPRPRPARHRESSRAVGIWAGRSRSAFTPSPWAAAIKDDEDLLLLARALLRG